MANKVLSHVWEHSKQKGSALLMLIAMADQSNDHGVCFPATDTLAKKCRVTRRQAQRLVDQLEASGEIIIYNRQDPSHEKHFYSNVYVIKMPGVKPVLPEPGIYSTRLSAPGSDTDVTTIVTPTSLSSDTDDTKIVTPASPDPLFNPTDNPQDNQKQQAAESPLAGAPAREAAAAAADPIPAISVVSKTDGESPPVAKATPPPGSAPPPAPAAVFKLYEQNIGALTPLIADAIKDAVKDFAEQWVIDAIGEAARANGKSWNYIRAILDRWKRDGRNAAPVSRSNGSAPRPSPAPAPTPPRTGSPGAPNLRERESRAREASERKAAAS